MGENRLKKIGYYSKDLNGHRASYLEFVQSKFGGERLSGKSLVFWKDPVFFLMVEDNFALYLLVSFLRVLIGRRTVGLLFRPKPAINGTSFRLKLKKLALKFLRDFSNVKTFSIVPAPLEPAINEIVDDWIYDFQLWDINFEQKQFVKRIQDSYQQPGSEILNQFEILKKIKIRNKKKILVAIGAQNKGKGIEELAKVINTLSDADYLVVVAGRFSQDVGIAKQAIEKASGLVFDRFITDDEILALYAIADTIWCFYDPSYDQASGILGRAIQLDVTPLVRAKSFSELLCKNEQLNHISINNMSELKDALNQHNFDFKDNKLIVKNFQAVSQSKLENALLLNTKV